MNNSENKKGSLFAFLSLLLGILSIVPILGILTAILAIIFGFIAIKKGNRVKLAWLGIFLAILFSLFINIFTFLLISKGREQLEQYKNSPELKTEVQNNIQENKTDSIDEIFKEAVSDPASKILVKGDLNNDGYEDAVVEVISCGTSCSINLGFVLNNSNKNATVETSIMINFNPSSASVSKIYNVAIENGVISLTGYGLDCGVDTGKDSDICTIDEWNILKNIKYKLEYNDSLSKYILKRV